MAHTHQVTIGPDVVRKRYVSWEHGEAEREWAGLVLLAEHEPDLAPMPLARETEDGAPVVVMSHVAGAPLGAGPLDADQGDAVALALGRLFGVPLGADLRERELGPSVMRSFVREWAADEVDLSACQDPPLVRGALELARAWLVDDDARLDCVADPVAAVGDGNLTNLIWDGAVCRMVDFEEFGVSDLAYEVADVVEHASSRLGRLLDVERLVGGLGLDEGRLVRLAAYRQLMAAFWLVMLLPGHRGFDRNPAGSTEDQAAHVLGRLSGPGTR